MPRFPKQVPQQDATITVFHEGLPAGVLLVDKPTGVTSHDVVNQVRRATGVKRVGHAGTLDPLATGLLVILIGRSATKLQSQFLHQDKEYLCTAMFGTVTDSYDRDGVVEQQASWERVQVLTRAAIEVEMSAFRGDIEQRVPAFSAVKVRGQKLYDRARRGTVSERELPTRRVHLYAFELQDFFRDEKVKTVTARFRVHCSSGTYIRSLIHDLGQSLGTGAIVMELRRTKVGALHVDLAKKNPLVLQGIE